MPKKPAQRGFFCVWHNAVYLLIRIAGHNTRGVLSTCCYSFLHYNHSMNWKKRIAQYRSSSKARLVLLGVLLAILVVLICLWGKFRAVLIALAVVVLGAIGMEVSGNDWDMQTLIETGSFEDSAVEKTEVGTWLIGDTCSREYLNCSNFAYQEEAQTVFNDCGGKDNDVHNLDRDKDGIVCEALPKRPDIQSTITDVFTDEPVVVPN